jgi:hypothetical protein
MLAEFWYRARNRRRDQNGVIGRFRTTEEPRIIRRDKGVVNE